MALPVLLALASAYGLLLEVARFARWYQVAGSVPLWRGCLAVLIQTCLVAFFLSVAFAALKRPRWGRAICAVFAVIVMAWIVWRAFNPDPHPRFEIAPGAQHVGALIAQVAMVSLSSAYAYAMVFGRKVKDYFSSCI